MSEDNKNKKLNQDPAYRLRDESGELQELVENFVSETDDNVRQSLVDQILIKWAEVGVNRSGFNPTQERLKETQERLKEKTELKTAA